MKAQEWKSAGQCLWGNPGCGQFQDSKCGWKASGQGPKEKYPHWGKACGLKPRDIRTLGIQTWLGQDNIIKHGGQSPEYRKRSWPSPREET
jgi:hypothetical protein